MSTTYYELVSMAEASYVLITMVYLIAAPIQVVVAS